LPILQEQGPLKVTLYQDQGETSRLVYAEIDERKNLVVFGIDTGEDPLKFWGDFDYEFWITVNKTHKGKVLEILVDRNLKLRKPLKISSTDTDNKILALINRFYKGHPHAVDEFQKFLKSKNIPCKFGSYA
jgi:hypothetical protein